MSRALVRRTPPALQIRTQQQRKQAGKKKNGKIVVLGSVCCKAHECSDECKHANQSPVMAEDAHN